MSILFLHGVGGRSRSWGRVLACLDPSVRRRARAVDVTVRPGQAMAAIADEVMEQHPGFHVVVGHSFGGMLAQEMALRDRAYVRGLVLVSTIPGATTRVAGINRALADDIERRGIAAVAGQFATGLFAPGRLERDRHLGAEFVADMLEAGETSVCAALRAIAEWDASERLPGLRCPAVVVTGESEPDLDHQALLAELIGAQHVTLGETGHLAPLEAPADVARVITDAEAHRIDAVSTTANPPSDA